MEATVRICEAFSRLNGGFLEQKKRDNLKIEYIEENEKLCLVRFNYDDRISRALVLERIHEALDSEVGYV